MKILKELIEIKKELQNIRLILESEFVRDYTVKREKDKNGKTVRTVIPIEKPLIDLRRNLYHEK